MGQDRLPVANWRKHAKTLERLGWKQRQGKGSHAVFSKPGVIARITIPRQSGDLSRLLLQRALKRAGISEDEYLKAFEG